MCEVILCPMCATKLEKVGYELIAQYYLPYPYQVKAPHWKCEECGYYFIDTSEKTECPN